MAVEFSVIIPTFRRPDLLRQAALSVLTQRDVSLELIIVDDSPEQSAKPVADSLGDVRVRYLANPRPSGGRPSVVRNLALKHASGDYVHFLDDDDLLPVDDHYATVRTAFTERPDIGLVFGRIQPFGDCSPSQLMGERAYFERAARRAAACATFGPRWGFTAEMLFGRALLVCSAASVRRACAEAVGGFDPEIRLMEDADFNLRIIREFGGHFLDRTVLNYRIGSPSLMHDPDLAPAHRAEIRAGCRRFRSKYQAERGVFEFCLMTLLSRGAMPLIRA